VGLLSFGLQLVVASEPVPVRWKHLSSASGEIPVPVGGNQQTACVVANLDGEGTVEIVIAERTAAPSLVSLSFVGGKWLRRVIDDTALPIEAGGAVADINQDGKPDLVFGGDWRSNQVWWWENPGGAWERAWRRHLIKAEGSNQHHDQLAGDFLGIGRPQIVFWNQRARRLFLAPIPSDPTRQESWKLETIWTWSTGSREGLTAADLNGDGRPEIVGGGCWFEHIGGNQFRAHLLDDYGSSRSATGDLDGDGRPEVILCSGDGVGPLNVYWYRDDKWQRQTLIDKVIHGHSLDVGDINGDGHLDIYAAEMHTPGAGDQCHQWVLYGDGAGKFRPQVISRGICNHESRLADVDGDGQLDIVGKPYTWQAPRLDVWLNQGPATQ
jgi:hypothetical protein